MPAAGGVWDATKRGNISQRLGGPEWPPGPTLSLQPKLA